MVKHLDHASVTSVGQSNATMLRRDLKPKQPKVLHLLGNLSWHGGSFIVLLCIVSLKKKRKEKKTRHSNDIHFTKKREEDGIPRRRT
jgi:hypothetical protein